jgi:hypothetical protein
VRMVFGRSTDGHSHSNRVHTSRRQFKRASW